jgi:peroxiredoxin
MIRPAVTLFAALRMALLASLLLACPPSAPKVTPPSTPSTLLGKTAPDFKRPALDGKDVSVAAGHGKVVVVKFMASYCEPCKRTLPAIEKLHGKDKDILVIGVAEDEREADAQALVASYKLTFPVVHDRQNILAARFRVRELPVTFVLDVEGRVAWVGGPEKTEDDIIAAIEATKP